MNHHEITLNRDVTEEEIGLGDAVLIGYVDVVRSRVNGQVGLVEAIEKSDRTQGHRVGRRFKVRTAEWLVHVDITELAGRLEVRELT